MTEKLTALVVDAQTGISSERDLTAEEIADRQQAALEQEQFIAEQQAKIAARQSALAKLAKLGLTQAEIDAL